MPGGDFEKLEAAIRRAADRIQKVELEREEYRKENQSLRTELESLLSQARVESSAVGSRVGRLTNAAKRTELGDELTRRLKSVLSRIDNLIANLPDQA